MRITNLVLAFACACSKPVAALRAVPDVIEAIEDDREVWAIRGEPDGVDELAAKTRAQIDRQRE